MPISLGELDDFLVQLRARTQRVQGLAPRTSDDPLVAELDELSEQLLIAEEELRVQQEELAAANQRLAEVAAEQSLYGPESGPPVVLTDDSGVVLGANRAVGELLLGSGRNQVRRPIATWFAGPDRAAARTLISSLRAGRPVTPGAPLHVTRRDGGTIPVAVSVERVTRPGGAPALRWELVPSPAGPSRGHLHAVPEQAPRPAGPELTHERLIALSARLAAATSVAEVASIAAYAAVELLGGHPDPGQDGPYAACVSLTRTRAEAATVAGTRPWELEYERRQLDMQQGPVVAVLQGAPVINLGQLGVQHRWPRFAALAAEAGLRSALSVRIELPAHRPAALTVYTHRHDGFDVAAVRVVQVVAAQTSAALTHVLNEENLRVALETRQRIGEAVGIVVERHRLRPQDAFDELVKASQRRNVKLREIAELVVETGQDPHEIQKG